MKPVLPSAAWSYTFFCVSRADTHITYVRSGGGTSIRNVLHTYTYMSCTLSFEYVPTFSIRFIKKERKNQVAFDV